MPALEDIVYSDDEEDVGAEADFSNLGTNISVSPIPTTRVHKDHPVYQIINGKSASTLIDTEKPLLRDPDVTPKVSHLHAVKRIFRYLKCKPYLSLWYPKDSPFNLVAYSDSNYARASLDKKSTTGGCQFLGCRLISWQCKKQTNVATSSTEAEYIAAASCCAQVLWIQNQLLDYGYLKCKPYLSLWYPKDSPFNLVAYFDSDYARASLDKKSTTGGCQFLGCRLISWQCKKQTNVATSSTEAEYIAAASCCAQVLWIQNQLLDYGHFITAISSKLMLFGLMKDVVHLMLLGHKSVLLRVSYIYFDG
nr:putative ribonuclease H-like domain-containing protein [Tanacetum cinerariifolium]